jgi:hypothetical protein
MRIAAHILAYNVDKFIEPVINNLENNVEKIFIAYSKIPFNYNKEIRYDVAYENKTSLSYLKELALNSLCEIEIIEGVWDTEEDMRNSCLTRAREDFFDWLIIQDADEFYTKQSWIEIKNILLTDTYTDHFTTTWYQFWKSPKFVIQYDDESIKSTNAGFAVRCKSDLIFENKRTCNFKNTVVLDIPCFHYGYIWNDDEMQRKIKTWSHSNDFFTNPKEWYELKWKSWDLNTKNLNIAWPSSWKKAIVFPYEQPEFASQFINNNIEDPIEKSFKLKMRNYYYDIKVTIYVFLRFIKCILIK